MIVNHFHHLIAILKRKYKDIYINHEIADENIYLKKANEDAINEINLLKEDFESKLFELTEIENKNAFKLKEFNQIFDNQTAEINTLKKRLKERDKNLSSCNNGFEISERELSNLNQVVNIYRSEGNREDISLKEMLDLIKHHKCVIIGGHVSWQDKIKALLPNMRFVNADEVTKDISFLTNYNIIFFNESINSHSMFNKIKSLIDFKNIPFAYIGQHTNVEMTIQSIYNEIKHLNF